MLNFTWKCPTRLVFGKDSIKETGKQLKALGAKRILMVYGGGSIKKNGVYDKVINSLKEENIEYIELSGVQPNPRLGLVLKGLEIAKSKKIDMLLGVGGGSVMDTCKAISFGLAIPEDKDIWDDYFMVQGKPIPKGPKVGAVLTIPAAGSEMSNSCVITNEKTGYKRGIGNENNYPDFAILDPQVCYSLPKFQIACGCSDMLSHLMERYFTNTQGVALTSALLEGAMRTIIEYGPKAYEKPETYEYWEQIVFAGTLAHNNLFGCGREQDWGSHWIEHELSGQYDMAHGAGLAIITPAWMKYVWKENPDIFMEFASKVMGSNFPKGEELVFDGIKRLEKWYKSMNLSIRLSEENINNKDFDIMAKRVLEGGRTHAGNLKKLYNEDIKAIFNLAL
ncbi:MAG: iron-containing alcohol dehydrogenase [Sphaerochaetaceae bacterium]|nr:iron-containing alcohol dehydrogenase [Sphaerochaetaceae bacterium]